MIECIINGVATYPDASNKIKLTFENPFIKDSGEYSYQITFPMSIPENKKMFRNVNRFEVKKRLPDYEDCILIVNNHIVMRGKGTVLSITESQVKLQIIGGNSRIKYNAQMASHFIDEIDYPAVALAGSTKTLRIGGHNYTFTDMIETGLKDHYVVGVEGEYAFNPTYDESNDIIANRIIVYDPHTGVHGTSSGMENYEAYMYNLAVQPYLMYVLEEVLKFEGFTVKRNDYNRYPWNKLVICSARKGTDIKLALPHWSSYTFIEEVRKLFNATFSFDEEKKTVEIISRNELTNNEVVSYECLDEFTSEYDEDGLTNLAVGNVEYEFAESSNRNYTEIIPQKVLKKFPVYEYNTEQEAQNAARSMTTKEKTTSIFKVRDSYILYVPKEEGSSELVPRYCGQFSPLIRDEETDDSVKLNICPVAFVEMDNFVEDDGKWYKRMDVQGRRKIRIPSISNDKEPDIDSMTLDEENDGEYYISVLDALEDSDILNEQAEDDDEKMQLMFQDNHCMNYEYGYSNYPDGQNAEYIYNYPVNYTDAYAWLPEEFFNNSLSLHKISGVNTIGDFMTELKLDDHNQITTRFPSNDVPDPRKLYLLRNKLYICAKIEVEVSNEGVERIKTGYFYEIEG